MKEFLELERRLNEQKQPAAPEPAQKQQPLRPVQRPQEPDPSECCGNGCPNCVWLDYWDKLNEYEEYVRQVKKQKEEGGRG